MTYLYADETGAPLKTDAEVAAYFERMRDGGDLKATVARLTTERDVLADEVERLTLERDEARREANRLADALEEKSGGKRLVRRLFR